MVFNIFLDTNVVLDWLLDRPNCFADEASKIIEISEQKGYNLFISSGSIFTISYILERSGSNAETLRKLLLELLSILKIIPTDNIPFVKACSNGMKDIEDAFQYEIASSQGDINYFVTGNIKDFKNKTDFSMIILSPKEILKYL